MPNMLFGKENWRWQNRAHFPGTDAKTAGNLSSIQSGINAIIGHLIVMGLMATAGSRLPWPGQFPAGLAVSRHINTSLKFYFSTSLVKMLKGYGIYMGPLA